MTCAAYSEDSAAREKLPAIAPDTAPHGFGARKFDANKTSPVWAACPDRGGGQETMDNPTSAAYYFPPLATIARALWGSAAGNRCQRRQTGRNADKKTITANPWGELS